MTPPHAGGDPARDLAWRALEAWEEGRAETVTETIETGQNAARDLALARELALGAVRWLRLYDRLCDTFLKPGLQPPPLRRALRLGCHQLLALDRIPPHAAVDSTVDLLRRHRHPRLGGVANAVLRRIAGLRQEDRQGDGPLGRLKPEDQPAGTGIRHSLPDLLLEDLLPVRPGRGEADWEALSLPAPLCTRTIAGCGPPAGRSILRREGEWTWWDEPQEALGGPVADGRCVVQDPAQGEVVLAARPRAGDLVLDLCAAPGGKARALAERGCRVLAGDVAGRKMHRLPASLPRLVADGRRPPFSAGIFDLVLVDAPCSNSGVLARRPEARWRYDRAHLQRLETLQKALLSAAAPLVRSGGRLVYSTCSLSPRENQVVAQGLPGWRILAERLTWPGPWHGGGYVAVLVR